MEVSGQLLALTTSLLGKEPLGLGRELGGPQNQSACGGKEKISCPFQKRALVVQPLVSHCTDSYLAYSKL